MKQILFLTTSNLTTNPRLLKELHYLSKFFQCTFVGFHFGNWSDSIDEEYRKSLSGTIIHYISASRRPWWVWLRSSFVQQIAKKSHKYLANSVKANAYASDKRTYLLTRHLSGSKEKYDMVIAHNLGALYPAYQFAKKQHIPFSFDIEDYHPGEFIRFDAVNEKKRRELLMKTLLPRTAAITYASPLIGKQSLDLVGEQNINNHFLINNSFFSNEFKYPAPASAISQQLTANSLKLIWFSQNIDRGRGLEQFLPVLDRFSDQIELHLIGNVRKSFKEQYLNGLKNVVLHGPMTQQELHAKLSKMDVGLALEPGKDLNNSLALSNKIFAYTQAGLFVLATDTDAQEQFVKERPWSGAVIKQDQSDLSEKLDWVIENIEQIRSRAMERFENAKELAWEKEGEKLKEVVDKILMSS